MRLGLAFSHQLLPHANWNGRSARQSPCRWPSSRRPRRNSRPPNRCGSYGDVGPARNLTLDPCGDALRHIEIIGGPDGQWRRMSPFSRRFRIRGGGQDERCSIAHVGPGVGGVGAPAMAQGRRNAGVVRSPRSGNRGDTWSARRGHHAGAASDSRSLHRADPRTRVVARAHTRAGQRNHGDDPGLAGCQTVFRLSRRCRPHGSESRRPAYPPRRRAWLREIALQHREYFERAAKGETFLLDNLPAHIGRRVSRKSEGRRSSTRRRNQRTKGNRRDQDSTKGSRVWGHLGPFGGYFVGSHVRRRLSPASRVGRRPDAIPVATLGVPYWRLVGGIAGGSMGPRSQSRDGGRCLPSTLASAAGRSS